MRRIWITIMALSLFVISAASLAGCERLHILSGSGTTINQNFSLEDFTQISAAWTFNVEISQGAAYSVNITVDDNLQGYLEVAKEGDTLKIGMKNGYSYNSTHFKAVVTMPRLTELSLSGASKGDASGFNSADDFILNVSGASQATFTSMVVNKLTLDISGASRATGSVNASGNASLQASGASNIELTGKAVDANIESSGASKVDLTAFTVRDANVNISGASNATVSALGTLSGEVSGASRLYYTGAPTLGNIQTTGASSVSKSSLY
jgi:hypothetical protein